MILWRKAWQPTPVFLPGESHGQRSLVGYSPWGRKELDTTEQLTHKHNYLSRPCLQIHSHTEGLELHHMNLGGYNSGHNVHLCEMSRTSHRQRTGKSIMTKSRLVVARGWTDRRIGVTARGCKCWFFRWWNLLKVIVVMVELGIC